MHHERIAPETWHELVRDLTAGIREGRACTALCSVITRCGAILAEQFPRKPDDVNELADEVLV